MKRPSLTLSRGLMAAALLAAGCGAAGPEAAPDGAMMAPPDAMMAPPDAAVVGCQPPCAAGLTCQGASCAPVPSDLWVLTVGSGRVADKNAQGEAWDPFGGKPDPQVCLTIGGQRTCTKYADDTLSPTWNTALPATTATALLGGVTVEIEDYDPVGANELICPKGVVPVRAEHFQSGTWNVNCDEGGFTATLRAQ